jgi:Ca-activated chloride channel family protein
LASHPGWVPVEQKDTLVTFTSPALLWLLLLIPAAIALYAFMSRRRARYAVRFPNMDVLAGVAGEMAAWRRRVPPLLFLLALTALTLGLARPQATVLVPRNEATVILSIDTSSSMSATDVEPSRLAAAKDAADAFVKQLPNTFRVALISFSDEAQVLAQPTTDRVGVREALLGLQADGATAMGDSMVRGLRLAQRGGLDPASAPEGERDSSPRPPLSVLLLLSDGANTAGDVDPDDAARRARSLGVPVFTIALGTPEGVLESVDQFGRMHSVPVPPDFDTLRAIAETTDAQYFTAPTEEDLRRVYEDIGSRLGFVKERQEVTFAFTASGLVLACVAAVLGGLWGGRLP